MRRDMDIIRQLLLKLEAHDLSPGSTQGLSCYGEELAIDGVEAKTIGHHLEMLVDAGLITVKHNGMINGHEIYFERLSWKGHEFLAAIRDKEIWAQTKDLARRGGTEGLTAIWDIAKALGKAELKRRTGLEF